ncbi:MAG: hypothetical protein JXX28_15945 [Deltaproteobacteria bacterium]|nr:hypothetical protein [Deltaproteobacteria bacterium]
MKSPWPALALLALAACQQPTLPDVEGDPLFDGGDGLTASFDRVVSGEITEDLTLDAEEPWILDGRVVVTDGATLTVEAGATVYGNPVTRGTLVIGQGSRIVAEGTAAQPIVFTSPRARGARRAGDWGGLVLNGYAPVNNCEGTPCTAQGEAETGTYGGSDPEDDSGVLRYVRVEFAGALVDTENELNGISFQGVGSGTAVDYIQLHETSDDGIEFFGGTVDVRHVVITGAGDDSLDWTYGWRGRAQYVAIQPHPGSGDRGIEADNSGSSMDALPRSAPVIANLTMAGHEGSGIGMNLRRGTGAGIFNSILTGYDVCLDIDDDPTWANGLTDPETLSGDLIVAGSWLDCPALGSTSTWNAVTVEDFLAMNQANVYQAPLLADGQDADSPEWTPTAAGTDTGALALEDEFFEITDFVGAIGDDDWTTGWTQSGTD